MKERKKNKKKIELGSREETRKAEQARSRARDGKYPAPESGLSPPELEFCRSSLVQNDGGIPRGVLYSRIFGRK